MNATEVIESYVADVVGQLPRKQRNDVGFELRALLNEELQARAEDTGREADAVMATDLVRAFGRPAEVALRYRPALTIIDPADGPAFLRASIIGLAIIWSAGLLVHLGGAGDWLTGLGRWWTGTVIPSLWWPGVLVAGFGIASWSRHRWPGSSEWKPRDAAQVSGGRAAMVLALLGVLVGLLVLLDPSRLLDLVFAGRAAPAAYDALTYSETFRQRQGPWLLLLLALNIPLFIAIIVSGRRSMMVRRLQLGLGLLTSVAMIWTVLDGPVLNAPAGDRTVKFLLVLILAFTLITLGWMTLRGLRELRTRRFTPAP